MKDFISEFGLTFKQTCLLFSLERQIVVNDIVSSKADKKQEEALKKQMWLNAWEMNINNFLNHLGENQNVLVDITKLEPKKLLEKILNEKTSGNSKAWRYLILLECTLFTPYYPLEQQESYDDNFVDKIKKAFGSLSLNENSRKTSLIMIAELLNIDIKYIDIFRKRHQEALRSLSGFWKKVLLAGGIGMLVAVAIALLFINPIAAFFAAPGLAGAAAFSAGMAALGGGAIAAGGFGIAGGIAVLVGGALLLGGGVGVGIGTLAASSSVIVLTELAKMEVVLKEIILGIQHDIQMMQEIIMNLNDSLNEMQKEVVKLKMENEKNKEKIKNLEESIEYLKKAIDEFQNMK
ncbi:coiled-coil domain-containing protein [Bacteroides acidifaciens]|jgi:Zn-ribbon protein, possibly nucleic acid-binding|uniref:coiled-coil domain-containing protein n=1 Tax=Bacteroides acidifaciens TaxID=85831 RepID=UPI0016050993|nr:hypothetical protein [Bacteroides acidifaciens]